MTTALKLYELLPSNDEGFVYDTPVTLDEGSKAHIHHTGDDLILRIITTPNGKSEEEIARLRNLAYDTITLILSETTNNDACDVIIRERSAHFASHEDLKRDPLTEDLSDFKHLLIDAYIIDYLS